MQNVQYDFKWADANKDGYLTLEEVQNKYPSVVRDFSRIDRDGDGRISFREFAQAKRESLERKFGK